MYILITFSFFQIQELGLQQQYNNDRGTYQYLRQIMALAFLPEDEIEPMFEHLKAQAATDQLRQFVEYVSQTWIHNQTWPPSSWSVYMMAIRSNNDTEGWHHDFTAVPQESGICHSTCCLTSSIKRPALQHYAFV